MSFLTFSEFGYITEFFYVTNFFEILFSKKHKSQHSKKNI